jgi:hypothetical protein
MIRKGLLFVAVGWVLIHHLFFYYGHFGFDDLHYAELAHDLYRGRVDFANQYTYRIVPLALWGLSYQLFGIHDWSSALPGLILTAGILGMLYVEFRKQPVWMFGLATAAFFGMKWNLFYSDKIMADTFVSAFVFGGWAWYHLQRTRRMPATVAGIFAAASLFLAFNSKGTLILIAPLFLVYLLFDLSVKRWSFWRTFIPGSVVLLGLYFLASAIVVGTPLARFQAIEGTHYLNPCSYDVLPFDVLVDRLTWGFYGLLKASGLLVHAVFALSALLLYAIKPHADRAMLVYPATVLGCLLSINFMTISLVSYNPVCLDPRHILLFSPIVSVCSAYTFAGLCRTVGVTTRGPLFYGGVLLVSAALLYPSFALTTYSPTLKYAETKRRFHELIAELPRPAVVYGSEVSKNLGAYYTSFRGTEEGLYFRNIDHLPPCPVGRPDTARYLIQNWYADWHADRSGESIDTVLLRRGMSRKASSIRIPEIQTEELYCE